MFIRKAFFAALVLLAGPALAQDTVLPSWNEGAARDAVVNFVTAATTEGNAGWIAPADCVEVRVGLSDAMRMAYATAEPDERYRLAACAAEKLPVVERLVERHRGEPTLVIGQYLDQLDEIVDRLGADLITGETSVTERQRLFAAFRTGEIDLLVVSKVANFSVDLPEASVAVQVSGTFGSRQEEAQRLGRVMRPKGDGRTAHFYTIVARDTVDAEFAAHRQRFLAEQGYAYRIVDADDV